MIKLLLKSKKKYANKLNVGSILILLLFTASSCLGNIEKENEFLQKAEVSKDSLIGVLVWNSSSKEVGKITFLNKDLKSTYSFEKLEEFGKFNWRPFSYSPDYSNLVIRVVAIDSLYFHVCVSENTNEIKLISRSSKMLNFQSWRDHILTAFSIDFDSESNPLYVSIGSTMTNKYEKDQFYHPVSIKDEWLCIEDDDGKQSFIKWCENGKLLIDIFYVA